MTKISLNEINRAFNKLAALANVKSYAVKRELETEGGYSSLLVDFITTLIALVNCVDPEQVICTVNNKSYIFTDYVQPLNSMLGKLISAGPIILGNKSSSQYWALNVSVPNIEFDKDVTQFSTKVKKKDEEGKDVEVDEITEGKVVTPKAWKQMLETLSDKFKLNYSFEQAMIQPIILSSVPGTFDSNGKKFYVWNDNVAMDTTILYFLNYKSVLASGKLGAIEKIHDIDFSTFITGKGE